MNHFTFLISTTASCSRPWLCLCATQLLVSQRMLRRENTASDTPRSANMAASGAGGFAPVLAALSTMQSNAERSQKSQAHEYLERFQKSPEAWSTTHSILSTTDVTAEAKLFAATTLKGKITYDLDQLPRQSLPALRDSILNLLNTFCDGPRPIRTQLCVCLVNLAIQMIEWKNVLQLVGSSLGNSGGDCVLDFLRVLPEEVTEGRKINLTVCGAETSLACSQTPSALRARIVSI